ncbi:MAG: AMP-binding protein [Oscillatoriales cyanobacterium SM2_3_0]|nr:AMP-binding protein [Oscillatoriales cyanobacterium SM2_3_0]
MKTYLSNILSLEKELDLESEYFIHQLFEAQVLKTPAAIAAIVQDQKLTYEELNIKANQVAHYLRALAIGPEILVGVCLERSLEMLIVSLGVLKAGAAYVPLDPTHPQERLALVIMDARMPILLTQTHLINTLPQSRTRLIAVDQAWDVIIRQPLENPINLGIPDDLRLCHVYPWICR